MIENKVLVADDTPLLQTLMSRIINEAGVNVDVVDNGEQALQAALSDHYKIVFIDIQMPIMDGNEVIKTLRAKGYDQPVIAMSSEATQQERQRCLALGSDDFIGKPVQREQLYDLLDKYVNNDDQILRSTLHKDNPNVARLVKNFLAVLPDYIEQCRLALNKNDERGLKNALHSLKGMGGSFGFEIISELAQQAVQKLKQKDLPGVTLLLDKLEDVNCRAQNAHKEPPE